MVSDTITGSRIRERRIILGLRQAELARRAGISASYLNLIEHNRRRIAGKLLSDIAQALGVTPAVLSQGAEAALTAALREAAATHDAGAELDRVDEFAGRFPGWAQLLARTHARIAELEATVQTLSDRLTHDPHLAASLHEMLSTVTAIRSTASILAEPGDLEPEWQQRFHRNINEDSARLAETSQALVAYLDTIDDAGASSTTPQDEVDAVLQAHDFTFPQIEDGSSDPAIVAREAGIGLSDHARRVLTEVLRRYAADAQALPFGRLTAVIDVAGTDPLALTARLGCDPGLVLRRLAVLPPDRRRGDFGLAVCDSSGALLFRKSIDGFALPRHGAACTLLPLFSALLRPGVMVSEVLHPADRQSTSFLAYAFAGQVRQTGLNRTPLYHAHMLVMPAQASYPGLPETHVGVSCRICPRVGCPGRREPSILGEEARL